MNVELKFTHHTHVWRGTRSGWWRWDCEACLINYGFGALTGTWESAIAGAFAHAVEHVGQVEVISL